MEQNHKQILTHWLQQQGVISSSWLNMSKILGMIIGSLIVAQAWLMADILQCMIIENIRHEKLLLLFLILAIVFLLRAWIFWWRERVVFYAGRYVRCTIRHQVLDRLQQIGPAFIHNKSAGSWASLILEQIDNVHDYYARYLPQMSLAVFVPAIIIAAIFCVNWVAALILLGTSPFIPLFMIMIGTHAEDANKRNFQSLSRLSGQFLDCMRGMETIRIFGCSKTEIANISYASESFRQHTMKVLRLALLSSSVLEFFSSLSIAMVAVYFGFSYLGKFHFGYYNTSITLLSGFLTLILAPEFFQPLRDLGTFYHAKAQAISAADNLKTFLESPLIYPKHGNSILNTNESITLEAKNLCILSPEGYKLAINLNFKLLPGQRVAIVGHSGSGKTSLLNVLSGFLPYTGSLRVNNIELRDLDKNTWHQMLSWIGQNPQLLATTLKNNILLSYPSANDSTLYSIIKQARVDEFLALLPHGIDTMIGDQCFGISVGQAQRVAIARALLKNNYQLLLLDEPTASLDTYSEQYVMNALEKASQTQSTLMVTHQLYKVTKWDSIWVMKDGCIIEQGNYTTLCKQKGAFFKLLHNDVDQ